MSLNSSNTSANLQEMQKCAHNAQLVLLETSKPHDTNRSPVKYELIPGVTSLLIDDKKVVFQSEGESMTNLPAVVAFKLDDVKFSSLEIPMTNILKVQLIQPWFGPNSVEISFVAIPKASKGLHLVPSHSRDGSTWKATFFFREGGAIEFQKVLAAKHTAFRESIQNRQLQDSTESGLPEYEENGASLPPAYVE